MKKNHHKNEGSKFNFNIESVLDTKRFGFKVGKTDGLVFKTDPRKVLDFFKSEKYELIIARVPMNDVEFINDMENIGFRIKDIQVTYKYNLNNNQVNSSFYFDRIDLNDSSIYIRDFQESDTNRLVELAGISFSDYGHYFANNRLDKIKCREIYEDWAYNSCTNKDVADKIIVACNNSLPVGFLSFKIFKNDKYTFAAGGMGAVDTVYRGMNIFPNLIKEGLIWGKSINLDWEEHNVLFNNFSVNQSMNKMEFKPGNPLITMHCWL